MKKFLVALFAIASVQFSLGQTKSDTSKHLTFKGVPINGTLAEYVSKMKKSGFTAKGTKDGAAILEGEFATYKNCIVGVNTLKQKDVVSNIVVVFPNRDDWSSLSSNYFNLKELLTEKYGKPSEVVEEFQSFTPDSDGSKMTLVKLDECKYYTTYETDKGTIQLSIEIDKAKDAFVKLVYYDKINYESVRKQALDDL
jgi:hypothetical protein